MSRMIQNALSSLCAALPALVLCAGCAAQPEETPPSHETGVSIGSATIDPCRSVPPSGDGTYCGNDGSSGFDPTFFGANVLVTCINHATADTTTCRTSCVIAPSGTPDHCNPDPCAHVSSANNGLYCGRSTQNSFDPQDASNFFLYNCSGGKTAQSFFCVNGCTVAPSGQADHCN